MARRKPKLWIYIAAVIVIFAAVGLLVINGYRIGNGYKKFTQDLYDSMRYGIENNCLRAEYNFESTRLTEKNAFNVAGTISMSRFVNYRKNYEVSEFMLFDFGNGDRMWLYPYDNITMIIYYKYADGLEKTYITKEITRMVTFERLISTGKGNESWNTGEDRK